MMKKTNKKSILAIIFAMMLIFTSIILPQQASAVGKRGKIRSVRVTSVKKLTAGKTSKIKVKVNPKKVAAKVTFKTSNKSIATVSRKGVVRAKKSGRVTITVKVKSKNTKIKKIKINVIPKKKAISKKNDKKANETTDEPKKEHINYFDKKAVNGVYTVKKEDLYLHKSPDEKQWRSTYSLMQADNLEDAKNIKTVIYKASNFDYQVEIRDRDIIDGATYIFDGQFNYGLMGLKSTSNQEIINNLDYGIDQPGTENPSWSAIITGNGTANVVTRDNKHIKIIVRNFNPIPTLRYQCRKVLKEITNNSMTDEQKVDAILAYIIKHSDSHYELNIGTYHTNTDCTGYSAIVAQMLNLSGIDCCLRSAGYDKFYGQTPSHQNNLALINGKAYIIDENIIMEYSQLFDKNNCYIGYNTYYDELFPELGLKNLEGKLDVNIKKENTAHEGYNIILKKAGRL